MNDAQLIDKLGGPTALEALMRQVVGIAVDRGAIIMWKPNGIPWRYRRAVGQIAEAEGVYLPAGFLDGHGKPGARNGKLRSNGAVLRKGRRKTRKGRQ